MIVKKLSDVTTEISIDMMPRNDWSARVLLSSDRHLDNPQSDHAMQRRHLDEALANNIPVIDLGDLFCAMQGRNDRRGKKGGSRDENNNPNYYGSLIDSAYDFFEPYKNIMAVMATGNHETAVLKNGEIDLTEMLCNRLRDNGSQVISPGYRGYIRLKFQHDKKTLTKHMYFSHGAGGGGPVTRGVIQTNRRAVYLPDADIVVGGHIHESWQVDIMRSRVDRYGGERIESQLHITTPTYKDEFTGRSSGFHVENERPPKPIGAWWLEFRYCRKTQGVTVDAIRAR